MERGTIQFPGVATAGASVEVSPTELALILGGIDLQSAKRRPRYERPAAPSEQRDACSLADA